MSQDIDFPSDENGQVLRQMAEYGVDLTVSREIEFAHRAPDRPAAEAFAHAAAEVGFGVEAYEPDEESLEEGDTDWDIICTVEMVPTHENITAAENLLIELAEKHACEPDGWGFMH